jgi:Ca-activated chloride channel family protein
MTNLASSAPCLHSGLKLRAAERFCRWLVILLVLIALPNVARTQEPPPSQNNPSQSNPSQSNPGDPYTIRTNVDVVVLRATPQDRKNISISGLDKNDFQVYEDGVLQQIKYFGHEDIPVTVGLVVDNSGSMRSKRPDVIAAALAFARTSNSQDQMFVVNFNEKVSFGLPDNTPFTDQAVQLEAALSRIAPTGETALYDAVAASLDHLKKGSRDKKVLIVISDGGDNKSQHKLTEVLALIERSDAILYTIGIYDEQDGDQNPGVLKRLAKDTGGEAFLPQSLKDITPICERIAHDIRNQYTIAYVPTNRERDGSYRTIEVKASAPGRGRLSVRTRTGYFAPSQSQPSPTAKATDHELQK